MTLLLKNRVPSIKLIQNNEEISMSENVNKIKIVLSFTLTLLNTNIHLIQHLRD